jgi:hypothetical protein
MYDDLKPAATPSKNDQEVEEETTTSTQLEERK